ncbi:unnamed protein product [Coffea canephora]|uniref:Uncharacterized protein n=1 Tax=Coffea canephora TaxID=49390 RepID=A0A068VC56_COFCA|nr:unnamed protein product [Coffea canephora]
MHAEFLLLLQSLQVPTSTWDGISKLVDEYMNKSLRILELCNLLTSAINEMNRNLLKIDVASRSMSQGESLANIQVLAVRDTKLYGSLKWKNEDSTEIPMNKINSKNSTTNIICAITGAMTIISSILFCIIFCPIPVELEKEIHCELPQMKLFVDSVQELAKCFNNKSNIHVDNLFVAFLGHEMIEQEITETKSQTEKQIATDIDKLKRTKASIQEKSAALKVSLEVFELEVTKVFEEVLRGRNKLLQQITPMQQNLN